MMLWQWCYSTLALFLTVTVLSEDLHFFACYCLGFLIIMACFHSSCHLSCTCKSFHSCWSNCNVLDFHVPMITGVMCCKVWECPVPKSMFQLMRSVLQMLTLRFRGAEIGQVCWNVSLEGRAKLCRDCIVVCLVHRHSRSPRMIGDGIGSEHFPGSRGPVFSQN